MTACREAYAEVPAVQSVVQLLQYAYRYIYKGVLMLNLPLGGS